MTNQHEHGSDLPINELKDTYADREPSDLLETRTVAQLRSRGLLRHQTQRLKPSWIVAALAASLALFTGGMALGQAMATRTVALALAEAREQTTIEAAAAVQRAGSEYVRALVQFAHLADSLADTSAVEQGREAGLTTLYAAAAEFLRIAPEDPVSAGISAAFAVSRPQGTTQPETEQVIWF